MASAAKPQTTMSIPEPVSFVIELALPSFTSQTVFIGSNELFLGRCGWSLMVSPLKKLVGKKIGLVFARLTRRCLDASIPEMWVKYEFSVLERGVPSKIFVTEATNPVKVGPETHLIMDNGCQGFAHSYFGSDGSDLPLVNDTLTVRAVVTLSVVKEYQKHRVPLSDVLQKRNLELYSLNIGRDFVLVSSDGSEHPAHKIVLSAASPVFRQMLQSDVKETQTGRCEITDVDAATLGALLRFMYLGCTEAVKDNAKQLLKAADKYEVLDLKDRCEDALIDQLDMENVVDMFIFADTMSAPELKQAAHRFLAADPNKTLASEAVTALFASGNAQIIKEVFRALAKLPTE